jgi:CubicO group peptidase (beta-lactamase class C family)
MKYSYVLAAGCAVLSCGAAQASNDRIDQYLRREMARNHIPAAAVAVIRDGKVVKLATYGTADLERAVPAGGDTAFQIASATKLLTSALLMQLVGEGKIDLDAPLSRYIADAPPAWKGITVRHLAGHTSGLPRGAFAREVTDTTKAVEVARTQTLSTQPGETAAYGSLDFSILADIIEKAGGASLEQLLAQRVAAPLGMTRTRFSHTTLGPNSDTVVADLVPGRVATYMWTGQGQQNYRYLYPAYTFAAGGAFSSIHDMARFVQAMSGDGMLSAPLREQMWQPFKLNNGKNGSFGVGWTVSAFRGLREVGHSGGPALSDVVLYPERKLGVVVLTNQRVLVPYMARAIAGMHLPPAAWLNETGIADQDPARTARFKSALTSLTAKAGAPGLFAPGAEGLVKELDSWLPPVFGGMPPLSRIVLLADTPDHSVRTYRTVYGKGDTQRWTVKFDQAGLIADVEPVDE